LRHGEKLLARLLEQASRRRIQAAAILARSAEIATSSLALRQNSLLDQRTPPLVRKTAQNINSSWIQFAPKPKDLIAAAFSGQAGADRPVQNPTILIRRRSVGDAFETEKRRIVDCERGVPGKTLHAKTKNEKSSVVIYRDKAKAAKGRVERHAWPLSAHRKERPQGKGKGSFGDSSRWARGVSMLPFNKLTSY